MHSTIHSSGHLNASRFQAAQLGRLASERANRHFILPIAEAAFMLSACTIQLPPGEHLNGHWVIEFTIAEDGSMKDFAVLTADDEQHAAHAIEAIKKWRFRPLIKNSQPVEQRALQRAVFNSRDTQQLNQ